MNVHEDTKGGVTGSTQALEESGVRYPPCVRLLADTEPLNDGLVALGVVLFQIIQ